MTENKMKILAVFIELIPKLDLVEIEKLLAFGEGLSFAVCTRQDKDTSRNA